MKKMNCKKMAALVLSAAAMVYSIPLGAFQVKNSNAADARIESALNWAVAIANDDSHGYSQANRNGPDYDCSSLVIAALKSAGISTGSASYTGNMRSQLTANGFTWIPWQGSGSDTSWLQRGDILLREGVHTEFYLGNDKNVGAHGTYNHPETGDQTGREISVGSYWNDSWNGVLRYNGKVPEPINNGGGTSDGSCYPACSSSYSSIVDALNSIGVDSSYSNRKAIAEANGISGYSGTADQNVTLLNKLKNGSLRKPGSSSAPVITDNSNSAQYGYYPACSSSYTSIVDALKSIGVDSSFANRKVIAEANGISGYSGTSDQNVALLNKLKSGSLCKPGSNITPVASDSSSTSTQNVYYPACSSSYASIVDALKSIGVGSSYSNRSNIAQINGISGYSGTASQNVQLLDLLKSGKLIKSVNTVTVTKKWYESLTPVNLGNSFDAIILALKPWKPIRDQNNNVFLKKEEWKTSEMWRFSRNSDGSYTIINLATNKALDAYDSGTSQGTNISTYSVHRNANQRWFIYGINGGYVFRVSNCDLVMDVNGGVFNDNDNIQLWSKNDTTAQTFSIYTNNVSDYAKPKPSPITAAAQSTSSVSLSWVSTAYTDKYRIYRSTDNSSWTKLTEITGTSYTDTGLKENTKYFYKYESVNNFYTVSSTSVSVTTKQTPVYTVSFNANGGSVTKTGINVTYGSTYGTLPVPERSGYKFNGWFTASIGGTKITDSSKVSITQNQTLYAQWIQISYNITFDSAGGNAVSNASFYSGKAVGTLPVPERKYYEFDGWFTDPESGKLFTAATIPVSGSDITLYAHWTARKYNIQLKTNGGELDGDTVRTFIPAEEELPIPEKQSYIFEGWFTSAEGGDEVTEITSDGQILYAHWSLDKHNLYFDAGEGSCMAEKKSFINGKKIGMLPTAEREGFIFSGWFTDDGLEITAASEADFPEDVTVHALWTPEPVYGDLNNDILITAEDALILTDHLLNITSLEPEQYEAADVNGDGNVDIFDYILLTQQLNDTENTEPDTENI